MEKLMNHLQRFFACATFATFAGAAFAAPETFTIDASHSAPRFDYNHLGFSNQSHRFDSIAGKIVLDRAAKTGSVDVTIDAKTVNTGYAKFNEHIQAEDFFHTAKYPTITFKSTKVMFEGDKPSKVEGNLTMKGVTKPVTLAVTAFHSGPHPIAKKDAIGGNATVKVMRSEFNMGKNAPFVSDEVLLTLPIEAIKD
jgi:polyisoprenoid-binding protein YceI